MNVMENYNAWGSTNRTALSDEGAFYIERPEQLNRLNAFIESYMNRGFIDIKSAFNHLRARLNIAGIDFTLNTPVQEGHIEFPVTRHGGSFGTVPSHDLLKQGFYRDSGVPYMNFALQADVELGEGGMYNIDAKIVQVETEEGVEESWIPEESVKLDEESHWVLGIEFHSPEYTSKEGRAIQNDLDKKFKSYSGSGSGGSGWDCSFKGSKKELAKAKKYIETKYKKYIVSKETQFVVDESVEHLDEWGIPADQDAYYAANKKKWEKEANAKTRKQWKDAMKKNKKKKKKK